MRTPVRNASLVLGIVLVGCAVLALLKSPNSLPQGTDGFGLASGGESVLVTSKDGVSGKSGDELGGEPPGNTKGAGRPSDAVLAEQRLERRRQEIVEQLEQYKSGGLSGRHPNVVRATEDLKKIEAEQAAAGSSPKN